MALLYMNYLLDQTYEDATHNPAGQAPSRDLKLLYQHNEVHPIEVAQVLCQRGITSVGQYAITFGGDEDRAREKLDPQAGGGDFATFWAPTGLARDAQVATYLAVGLDAKGVRAELATARAAAQRDPTAKPITVPEDRKNQIKQAYRLSNAQTFMPLEEGNTPHNLLWDDAQTRKDRQGFMPFYYIFELRSSDEIVTTNKGLCGDVQELVKLSQGIQLATSVETIEDSVRRIMVFFMLATFINECNLEFGFRYKSTLLQWNKKMFPSLEAFIWADRECRMMVNKLLTEERGRFRSFEQAFVHVLDHELKNILMQALVIAGTVHKPIAIQDGSPTTHAVAKPSGVLADGHQQPNASGTGPVGTPPPSTRGNPDPLKTAAWLGGTSPFVSTKRPPNAAANWGTSGISAKKKARVAAAKARALTGGQIQPGKGGGKNQVLSVAAVRALITSMTGSAPANLAPGPGKGTKGPKGPGKGKVPKGKGAGGKGQPPVPEAELAWFKSFSHWGTKANGGLRCVFFNCSVGCKNQNCGFVDLCLVCGEPHPAVSAHAIGTDQQA